MNNEKDNAAAVAAALSNYFEGVYTGNNELLAGIFHQQALVAGDVKGVPYFKTVAQYLEGVKNRKSPKELGEPFRMEIISVEIINSIAAAKTHLQMFEYNYYDLLSLNEIDGKWIIVNKLLTHVNTDSHVEPD